jgi:hypothetical protein
MSELVISGRVLSKDDPNYFLGAPDPEYHKSTLASLFIEHCAEPYASTLAHFRRYFSCLGSGRHREVFGSRNGEEVLKVPWNDAGQFANERELEPDQWLGGQEYCARTRKDQRYTKRFGVLILRMERLTPAGSWKDLPKWTWGVDGFQVGYNRAGKLVAYDWG